MASYQPLPTGSPGHSPGSSDPLSSPTNGTTSSGTQSKQKLETLQAQVDQVTNVMTQNVEKILQRGNRLDDLSERTDVLVSRAEDFQRTGTRLQKKMWWKNTRTNLIIALIAAAVIGIILYFALR